MTSGIVLLIAFYVLIRNGGLVSGTTCTSSDALGNANYNGLDGNIDSTSNSQFVMTDSEYVSPCCGTVTGWNVHAGDTGPVVFQVFRPNSGGSAAELVGENSATVSSTGQFNHVVSSADKIQIQQNDIIGWWTGTDAIVEYKAGGSRNDNNYVESIAQPTVGDTVTFTNQVTDRTYGIYVTLDALDAPTFTNLDDTVNEFKSLVTSGTVLFNVTSSSSTSSSPTYSLQSITPSSHFAVDSSTGEVTATTSSVSATTYTLTISVSEACSDSNTATLTVVLSNTAPVWSNLDASFSVSKSSVSTSSASYTVVASNPDLGGAVSYSLQSISPSSHFDVNAGTGDVTATTSSSAVDATAYTLVIRASDAYGNYVDGTLTLTVVNLPPEITSLPDVADVSESAVDETLLHLINVTDADGDVITCNMSSSPSGPFQTKYSSVNGVFTTGLYLQANPSLDYSVTNAYELSVMCSDGTADDTGTLYVYVIQNNVPQISNLQNTTSILSTTPSSTVVFTVLATDAEEDTTYFSLACLVASPCPFSIYSDGSVVLSTSLVTTSTNGYELDISVRDDHSTSGTHRLTVFVTDLNTKPDINNLPAVVQLPEDRSVGTTVFTVGVYDEDGDSSFTFTSSFSPASGSAIFSLNSTTGEIVISTALNYLTQDNTYLINISANDGQTASDIESLTIQVLDVNQAPVLYQTNYQINVDEGGAGTEAPDPGFNVYEPDSDDLVYSWGVGGNDTSGFAINSTNGIVSFTIAFDAEDVSLDTKYVWLVVVADPDGLSATATLTLSILDANDNVPRFLSNHYAAVVDYTASPGTSVLTVPSTDDDRSEIYRELEYSIHGTNIFVVDHSGNVFVYDDLQPYMDTIETFYIRVRNPGENSYDTSNIAVSIERFEDNDGYFDNPANVAWVTLVCIFGPLVLICAAYLGYLAYQKWVASSLVKGQVTQVAPYDTRLATPPPYTPPKSRATVTPSDVRVIHESWEGWKVDNDWRA